jgi:SAM-dependent methyltransferase
MPGPDPLAVRRRFASHLTGAGVEIGPGHVPFPVPPTVNVQYVDRWDPSVNSSLFPELGEAPGFRKPDIVANLDADRLSWLSDASQDFVIASHVIEHLANPIAMLVDCYRVLRPGGLLVLLVPDRHKTFDRERSPTPLSHIIDEYKRGVREVDDAHVVDYMIGTRNTLGDPSETLGFTPEMMADLITVHRNRSVHAHVWNLDEFSEVLNFVTEKLGLQWEVIDIMPPGADGSYGDEFGWLLSRTAPECRRFRARRLERLRRMRDLR